MTDEFIRHGLTTSVARICSNIGWHSMSNSTLQMMTDILYEYFRDLAQSVKKFSEISDTITPDLDDVKMAFQDKDVSIPDLIKYLKQVGSVEFPHLIPKFPIPTKSNLNIMKPGSREIVTRPIYIHEHLPTMFPEQSDEKTTQNEKTDFNQTLQSSSSLNMFNDTSHFNETETSKIDKASASKMVTHRRLREISSVVMTTSGFLSPSREGKLPESRLMPISNLKASSNPTAVKLPCPKTLPDIKSQPHNNKQLTQKPAVVVKEKEKKIPESISHNVNVHNIITNKDSKFKKSSNLKEMSKPNKPLKKEIICESNQDTQLKKPIKIKNKSKLNLLNTIFDKPIQAKHPKYSSNEKLNAEPDKQKLNIFKKISKVKDDKNNESVGHSNSKTNVSIVSKPNSTIVSTDILVKPNITPEVIEEKPFKPVFFKPHVEEKKQDKKPPTKEIKQEVNSEVTKKRKKKQKILTDDLNSPNVDSISSNNGAKKLKIKHDPDMYSKFSFFGLTSPSGLLQPGTSLLPPSLASNPLVPKYTTPTRVLPIVEKESSITSMMYLPLPGEEDFDKSKLSQLSLPFNSEKEKVSTEKVKPKKGHKKIKKEKIKSKKKKEKKDKSKEKTKSERKKEKLLKKMKKDLEEPKQESVILEKKEELIQSILNEDDPLVPKIKLKFAGSNSPSSSSSVQRKIVIKPIVKNKSLDNDDTTVHNVSKEMPIENVKPAVTKSKVHSKDKNPTTPVSTLLTSNKEDSTVKTLDPKPSKSKKSTVVLPSIVENIPKSHEITSDPLPVPISTDNNAVVSGNKHKIKTSKKPKKLSTQSHPAFYFDESGNQVWICPTCGKKDDGSPMIGCDGCDAWYHWVCVGIQCPPDCAVWYCPKCLLKRAQRSATGLPIEKAKRGRPQKKKSIS